jgi:hypothetical protein
VAWVPESGLLREEPFVSIIRVGLAETKNYGDGYDAIFGKKKAGKAKKATTAKGSAAKKGKKAKKK